MNLTLKNKTVLACAKRGSGKSNIMKYLIQAEERHFKQIFLVCPTEGVNKFFSDFIPEDNIFESYNEKWVEALIDRMTKLNTGKYGDKLTNVLLVLDDCISDVNFHQSPTIKKLFSRGRHIGIGVIVSTQYLFSVPPIIRNNSDFILCGQMNKQSVGLLCDEYLSGNIERADFVKLYNDSTKKYGFLLINNNSVEDCDDLNQIYGIIRTPADFVR
jgi:hypothetical protein